VRETDPNENPEILQARAGDRTAYASLVRRYQDRVHRFILRMVGSREEAMDLTQDTFIKAWQALPAWRPEARFHTWLFRIASNTAMDALRRRRTVEWVPLDDQFDTASESPDPQAQHESKQRLKAMDAAIARLPAEQREAILLREVEDLSYAEIAAATGVNEGTVKSRLARARAALYEQFKRTDA
jgi:RNA polymerase sigma-70 factor (ECF subfamily)